MEPMEPVEAREAASAAWRPTFMGCAMVVGMVGRGYPGIPQSGKWGIMVIILT